MPAAPPPSADPLVALADRCVQCGLCLPACPTYGLDRVESESPRGRIALARAWALDTIEPSPSGDVHLDHCLGCRSCEAACPAGVEYGALLLGARERQRARTPVAARSRLAQFLAARPRWLAFGLRVYALLYEWLPTAWRLLPRPARDTARRAALPSASGNTTVAVFRGCVADTYERRLRHRLAELCEAAGIRLVDPPGQTCCGSLHAHAGNPGVSQRLAVRNRSAFTGAEAVLTLASGCHEALARALDGNRTQDAIEFLAERAGSLRLRTCNERVALHLPCTQRNVVRSAPALRRLLAQVPGLTVIELDAGYGCCGAAGMQMIDDPSRAARFRAPMLQQLIQSKATRLLSANIGCRLHFAQGTDLPVQHPLEFLAGLLDTSPATAGPTT